MQLAVALLYWVIVSLWLVVLAIVCVAYFRNPRIFGAARLLLAVLIIDTCRNISENLFFGLYWGGQYGLFPFQIASALGKPEFVILPKLMNVVAGCAVLGLLILKWLPTAMRDRAAVEAEVHRATEALRLESKRLDWLAHFDQLTELPNRISLLNDIEKLKRQHPRGHITSLALIDLDGFGNINDTLGYATGDQLLRDAAARLVSSCRGFARIYRSSGDEFVLLMTNCSNQSQVVSLIERALKELSERFDIAGHQLFLGASAGIAIASGSDDVAIDELVSNADLALNEARISGGHSCRLFQPPLRAAAQARRNLSMSCQPVLSRWKSADGFLERLVGPLSPGEPRARRSA
jgi:diguanylate cyclase (GGDEF)-like protein